MIDGAAFCPCPPALVPALSTGAAAEMDGLRAACTFAITRVAGRGRQLILLGPGAVSRSHSPLARGTLAGFGAPVEVRLGSARGADPPGSASSDGPPDELPLSLTVGAWLVAAAVGPSSAIGFTIGPGFADSSAASELLSITGSGPATLVVMGDGSARRSVKAPGYLDDRAEGFDARIASALAAGDAPALRELDAALGEELLAGGVAAWRVAGGLLDGQAYDAELLYDDDPYGVEYLVAAWAVRG